MNDDFENEKDFLDSCQEILQSEEFDQFLSNISQPPPPPPIQLSQQQSIINSSVHEYDLQIRRVIQDVMQDEKLDQFLSFSSSNINKQLISQLLVSTKKKLMGLFKKMSNNNNDNQRYDENCEDIRLCCVDDVFLLERLVNEFPSSLPIQILICFYIIIDDDKGEDSNLTTITDCNIHQEEEKEQCKEDHLIQPISSSSSIQEEESTNMKLYLKKSLEVMSCLFLDAQYKLLTTINEEEKQEKEECGKDYQNMIILKLLNLFPEENQLDFIQSLKEDLIMMMVSTNSHEYNEIQPPTPPTTNRRFSNSIDDDSALSHSDIISSIVVYLLLYPLILRS